MDEPGRGETTTRNTYVSNKAQTGTWTDSFLLAFQESNHGSGFLNHVKNVSTTKGQ